MIEVGKIYYLSGLHGMYFIRIDSISEKNGDNWVFYSKSVGIGPLINKTKEEIEISQAKQAYFEYIEKNSGYKKFFMGIVEVPNYIIDSIKYENIIDVKQFPFISIPKKSRSTTDFGYATMPNHDEYRNWLLTNILT